MDGERNTETQAVTVKTPLNGAEAETVPPKPLAEKPRRRGRPLGVPNKVGRIAKEAIAEAEPHSFLIRIMEGRKFKRAGSDGGQRTVACYPTLAESISAAETLLRKIVPDLKSQELTGDPDKPIGLVNGETKLLGC